MGAEKDFAPRPVRGAGPFRALVESPSSEQHLSATGSGGPVAALATEILRKMHEVCGIAIQMVRGLFSTV